MKKVNIMISLFVVIMVLGLVMRSSNGNYTCEQESVEETEALLDNRVETLQKAENSNDDQETLLVELTCADDDLVYREFTWGLFLENEYEIFIENDKIIREAENVQNIVVILDNNVYKEFSFDNNNIEFTLDKSGNYDFIAIDSDGNSVDITSIVRVDKPTNGGTILLNY